MSEPATRTFRFISGSTQLCDMIAVIEQFGAAHGVPERPLRELTISLAEAFSNILRHAYRGAPGLPFTVDLTLAGHGITATITDSGPEFDPRRHQCCQMTGLQEHGMGIHIYTSFMTRVAYQRLPEGLNQLTLYCAYPPAA